MKSNIFKVEPQIIGILGHSGSGKSNMVEGLELQQGLLIGLLDEIKY